MLCVFAVKFVEERRLRISVQLLLATLNLAGTSTPFSAFHNVSALLADKSQFILVSEKSTFLQWTENVFTEQTCKKICGNVNYVSFLVA